MENQDTLYIDSIDSVKLREGLPPGITLADHSQTFKKLLFGSLEYYPANRVKKATVLLL